MAHSNRATIHDLRADAFERTARIAQCIDTDQAGTLVQLNVDALLWLENDGASALPLCLIETAIDHGQAEAPGLIAGLARRAHMPAFAVLLSQNDEAFRVKRLYPRLELGWRMLDRERFTAMLTRARHYQLRQFEIEEAANSSMY